MAWNLFWTPDILGVAANNSRETAAEYNKKIDEKLKTVEAEQKTKSAEVIAEASDDVQNQKTLTVSEIIKNAIYSPTLTQSAYQFTAQENYDKTDVNDKTDTYVNMNTSYRYIKFNLEGAGDLYNKLWAGNDFSKDSPKKVFENIKNRLVQLWFNKKINEQGKLETLDVKNDADMLYMTGFFQTMIENKVQDASKKDFRIGPKTLKALLDDGNTLERVTIDESATPTTNTTKENVTTTTVATESTDNTVVTTGNTEGNKVVTTENNENTDNTAVTTNDTTENGAATTDNNEFIEDTEAEKPAEKIGGRVLPKVGDIYSPVAFKLLSDKETLPNTLFITKEDILAENIQNTEFLPLMYKSLDIPYGLESIAVKDELKKFTLNRMKQLDLAINEMKKGIVINNGEVFIPDNKQLMDAIAGRWFIKKITVDGKPYEAKFDMRTPAMKKSSLQIVDLWNDKEGKMKEQYNIQPIGLIYSGVNGLLNDKVITSVKVNNGRTLYGQPE